MSKVRYYTKPSGAIGAEVLETDHQELVRLRAEVERLMKGLTSALAYVSYDADREVGPMLWTERHWQGANEMRVLLEYGLRGTPRPGASTTTEEGGNP